MASTHAPLKATDMNTPLFEELLFEEEGPTLDFKVQQYPFANADKDAKSELIKDILGFVNAWRRGSEAFILIGIREVRGGRSEVVGIDPNEHLDDHSLQQFVNSLTNRPIQFGYEAFGYDNKQLGIIRISEQARPIYLKKDYGKRLFTESGFSGHRKFYFVHLFP